MLSVMIVIIDSRNRHETLKNRRSPKYERMILQLMKDYHYSIMYRLE